MICSKSEKIALKLLERIKSGELCGQLPSDKKVAEEFNVALMTATRALTLLQERGVVVRIPRRGTFTLADPGKVIRFQGNARFFEIFSGYLKKHRPEITLKPAGHNEEWDLCAVTTGNIFLSSGNDSGMMFPRQRVERLRNSGRYWDNVFDICIKNGSLYGIPYLFSPVLLHCSRSIMRKIEPDFDPVGLTMDHFIHLMEKAAEKGYGGIDMFCFTRSFFLNMIYCLAGHKPDELSIMKAAQLLIKVLSFRGRPFNEGNTLFTLAPRQKKEKQQFSNYDIVPMPELNGVRSCPVASETLIASCRFEDSGLLHDLCEETLSPEFQKLVTANRFGIAADKNIAMQSMKTTSERDDFFFTEAANGTVVYNDYPLETLQDIALSTEELLSGELTPGEFEKSLRETLARQKLAEKRSKRLIELNKLTEYAVTGETAV